MDFAFTPENEKLRQEVRDFIRENRPPRMGLEMDRETANSETTRARNKEFRQKVQDRGWLAMSWPKQYGGQEADRMDQFIVEEEFVRARVGAGVANEQAAAIMTAGTEEQKAYFLPRMLTGEVTFSLGYTEPSGGSDLASLKTRADEDGDFYVINGQKMFGGYPNSSHIYLMTRTDQDMPKHRGISIFLVPYNTPGISCTPLETLPGGRLHHVHG
jgi:alkylation response protein AidB-like acyl-CoA dehydrogenase